MRLLSLVLLGASLFAQPATKTQTAAVQVFVTSHGKTYHTYRDCMSLSRSKTVLTATEADAERHGLALCSICLHRHHAATNKGDNHTWANGESK